MLVNPFWFGVMTTVLVEVIALLAVAIWFGGKR